MKQTIKRDDERCTQCGLCAMVCRPGRITGNPGQVPSISDMPCGLCGQCIAACPTAALSAPELDTPPPTQELPDAAQVDSLLMQKRSVRQFTDTPVDPETIRELIEVARYSPSAKNQQDRVYLVCTDKSKIQQMDRAVAESLGKMLKILNPVTRLVLSGLPVVRQFGKIAGSLKKLVSRSRSGESVVFYDAPCVIAIAGRKGNLLARDDAVIAGQYIMLAAHARGLGSCIIGYASTRSKAIAGQWNIPDGFAIESVLVLGYPTVEFANIPPRKEVVIAYQREA